MPEIVEPKQLIQSGSQLIRDLWLQREEGVFVQEPEVMLMRLFASHAGIVHFRVEWKGKPLLLFADMKAKEYSSAWSYQSSRLDRMSRWASKKATRCSCIINSMDSSIKPSGRWLGRCLAQKEARIPTSCGNTSFLDPQTSPLASPRNCRNFLPACTAA